MMFGIPKLMMTMDAMAEEEEEEEEQQQAEEW